MNLAVPEICVDRRRESGTVELLSSSSGVHAVKSPVRVLILETLQEGEVPFDEIMRRTGRAKSTVSVHLRDMVNEGIVNWRVDPEDARKKLFFTNAERIGALSMSGRISGELARYTGDYRERGGDPFAYYRLMFRTIRATLMQTGINLDPIFTTAGREVGRAILPIVEDEKTDVFLENVAEFWKQHGLGRIEIGSKEPREIFVYDCFECVDLPHIGRPACSFDTGVLTALFSGHVGREVVVVETHCYAAGDPYCRFVIECRGQPEKS
ncbi:MAG: uncharacterized protein PWP08_33 [Methanofollis sp.]|nr:uncharacterized protein [Methanofollis sp.]